MKIARMTALLAGLLSLSLLVGCGAKNSETTSSVGEAHLTEEGIALYPEPIPSVTPDEADGDGGLLLSFETEATEGHLCVALYGAESTSRLFEYVFNEEDLTPLGDLSALAASTPGELCVADLSAGETGKIYLATPGSHDVYAFVEKDGQVISEMFGGCYNIEGAEFYNFAFSQDSGEYGAPFALTFEETDGAEVYYTLDGTAPLAVSAADTKPTETAKLYTDGTVLPEGTYHVTAQCLASNGLVSKVATADYTVSKSVIFDASGYDVAEDKQFDYILHNDKLFYYDRETGECLGLLTESRVTGLSGAWRYTTNEGLLDEKYQSAMTGELAAALARQVAETNLYLVLNGGSNSAEIQELTYQNGKLVDEERYTYDFRYFPYFVGDGWRVTASNGARVYNESKAIGTKEVAQKATLMVPGYAVWLDYYKSGYTVGSGGQKNTYTYQIKACDPDGGNERVLWEGVKNSEIHIHALTDKVILFRHGTEEMVYDLASGMAAPNPMVPAGYSVKCCTSTAIYLESGTTADLERVVVDYETAFTNLSVPTEEPSHPDAYYVIVTAADNQGVNIRSGPGTEYEKVREDAIPMQTKLLITQEGTSSTGKTWGYTTHEGISGWISMTEVTKTEAN